MKIMVCLRLYLKFAWILLLIFASSCRDEKCGGNRSNYIYDLVAEVDVNPVQATYRVGDTVWVKVFIPTEIENRRSEEKERVVDLDVAYRFYLNNIANPENRRDDTMWENVSILSATNGIDTLNWPLALYGEVVPASDGTGFKYEFYFEFDKAGTFWLNFGRFISSQVLFGNVSRQDNISLVNECPNGKFNIFNEVNGGANNNWNLLCESNPIYCSQAWDESVRDETYDRLGGYIFKVTQ